MFGRWIYVDLSLSRLVHDSSNESRELELEYCVFNASHHRRESNPVTTLNCPHRNHREFSKNVATLIVWRIWKRCGELHARICGFRRMFADWFNAELHRGWDLHNFSDEGDLAKLSRRNVGFSPDHGEWLFICHCRDLDDL